MSYILIFGVIALVFTIFFSILETSFHAANKLQLELEGRLGDFQSQLLAFFARHPAWLTATTFTGTTLSLVVFSACMAQWQVPILQGLLPEGVSKAVIALILIQTILSTLIVITTLSIIPRALIVTHHNKILSALVIPFAISFVILSILTFPLIAISKFLTVRIFRMKYEEHKTFSGLTDLHPYPNTLTETPPQSDDIELDKKIFHNALEFKTVKIRDCMIPRTEITAVELNESIEKLREAFVESGHSKVIIYKQSIDEIIGYCHSSALFKGPQEIKDILTPIVIVAETTLANELMIRFINERKSLAVVVDEFGGTSGLVSMEDVIEEIFGEIEDEHDEEDEQIEQKLAENSYLLSARLEIDYLNETYDWELPTGEYETLGGLILSYAEDFPKQGQTIVVPPFSFTIQTTGDNRIDTVMVKVEN